MWTIVARRRMLMCDVFVYTWRWIYPCVCLWMDMCMALCVYDCMSVYVCICLCLQASMWSSPRSHLRTTHHTEYSCEYCPIYKCLIHNVAISCTSSCQICVCICLTHVQHVTAYHMIWLYTWLIYIIFWAQCKAYYKWISVRDMYVVWWCVSADFRLWCVKSDGTRGLFWCQDQHA